MLNSEKDGAGTVAVMTTAGLACRGRDRPGACRTNLSLDPFKGAMFFILLDVNGSSEMEQVIPTCYLSFRNPVEILEGSRQVPAWIVDRGSSRRGRVRPGPHKPTEKQSLRYSTVLESEDTEFYNGINKGFLLLARMQ